MKSISKNKHFSHGFSLVEFVIVILIIAVLAVAVFAGGSITIAKSRVDTPHS